MSRIFCDYNELCANKWTRKKNFSETLRFVMENYRNVTLFIKMHSGLSNLRDDEQYVNISTKIKSFNISVNDDKYCDYDQIARCASSSKISNKEFIGLITIDYLNKPEKV